MDEDAKERGRRAKVFGDIFYLIGWVPCFVCGRKVDRIEATLEHIKPRSLGGTDDYENLAISHGRCNARRGNSPTSRNHELCTVHIPEVSNG